MTSVQATTTPVDGVVAGGIHRYAAAWWYLVGFVGLQGIYLCLGASQQSAFETFASTSVANLERDPVGCLIASAFITGGNTIAGNLPWVPLIAIGMFGAVRAVGGLRAVLACAAGHVIGTLVSEGIVAWRVQSGALPGGYRHLVDVGPSYVVVSALAVAIVCGPWLWRLLAVAGLAVLIFFGQIFSGLTNLDVAAVGHLTAITTTLLVIPFIWGAGVRRRPGRRRRAR